MGDYACELKVIEYVVDALRNNSGLWNVAQSVAYSTETEFG